MDFFQIIWDDEDDPSGNVEHIAEHGLTVDDVDLVLLNPAEKGTSRSTGLPVVWGYTPDRIYIMVVYEEIDEGVVRVVTASEVPEP